jgi:hypothetical protein
MQHRTPLNARTVGSFEREGYRVEKLIYKSQPNFYISANLYIPTVRPPFPGVLVQMGQTLNGRRAINAYTRNMRITSRCIVRRRSMLEKVWNWSVRHWRIG